MLENFKRERDVRNALRRIARQRVAMILQPGDVIVVENSPPNAEWFDVAARTAHIRGWVEILHDAMPTAQVRFEGGTPLIPEQWNPKAHYRLTDGGWSVIHGTHAWTVATFIVSLFALFASAIAVVVTWPK